MHQRALFVHDDTTCLVKSMTMLRIQGYQVTTCNKAKIAASILSENKGEFDMIIVTDFPMGDDKDAFDHLVRLALHLNLPVTRFTMHMENSRDKGKTVVNQQHEGGCGCSSTGGAAGSWNDMWTSNSHEKRKHKEEGKEEAYEKKRKLNWTPELQQKFVAAVNQLGADAVPSKILKLMNEPGLTKFHISSHLQKYRDQQKKLREKELGEVPQQQEGNINNSDQNASFDPLLSFLNESDLETLAPQNVIPAMVESEEVTAVKNSSFMMDGPLSIPFDELLAAVNNSSFMMEKEVGRPLSITFDEFQRQAATGRFAQQPNMAPHHQVAENTDTTLFSSIQYSEKAKQKQPLEDGQMSNQHVSISVYETRESSRNTWH